MIAVSAVGSLSEKIDKGHVILVDQFIDKTKHRKDTFFGNGIVAHVPFSEPCCATLRKYLLESCNEVGAAGMFRIVLSLCCRCSSFDAVTSETVTMV